MSEVAEQLKERTMRFALDVCKLIKQLSHSEPSQTVRRQLAKAATAVAFNYRAACRGRSHAEYTAKVGTVAEEADETLGWLELTEAAELLKSSELNQLIAEARELAAIMSASYGTAQYNERNRGKGGPYPITRLPNHPIDPAPILSPRVAADRTTTPTTTRRKAWRPSSPRVRARGDCGTRSRRSRSSRRPGRRAHRRTTP